MDPSGEPMTDDPSESPIRPARDVAIPDVLPILPLPEPLLPLAVAPIGIAEPRAIRLIDAAVRANRLVGPVARRDPESEGADAADLFSVGTAATVLQLARMPDGTLRVAVQGLERIRLGDVVSTEPFLVARVEVIDEVPAA